MPEVSTKMAEPMSLSVFKKGAAGDVIVRLARQRLKPLGQSFSVRLDEADHAYLLAAAGIQTFSKYDLEISQLVWRIALWRQTSQHCVDPVDGTAISGSGFGD